MPRCKRATLGTAKATAYPRKPRREAKEKKKMEQAAGLVPAGMNPAARYLPGNSQTGLNSADSSTR
jgi:hypothetical protein